jgi:hypothetical protein
MPYYILIEIGLDRFESHSLLRRKQMDEEKMGLREMYVFYLQAKRTDAIGSFS